MRLRDCHENGRIVATGNHAMMGSHMKALTIAIVAGVLLLSRSAVAEDRPAEPMKTLEDIEDVRLLFCSDAYRIHELETLITYARGFGAAELDPNEPYEWHRESLEVFEFLKSTDDAGQDLMAWADAKQANIEKDVQGLRDLSEEAGRRVLEFHARLDARIAAVRDQLGKLAEAKGLAAPAIHEPMPWPEPQREIGRRMGFTPAWYMWLNQKTDSARAALDRQQQPLDNSYLLRKAAKIGIRAIVPEFAGNDNEESCSWRVVEPEEGKCDFSRIDSNIESIAAHGLKTIIPIRSFSTDPPEWAAVKLGDASRIWRFDAKENKAVPGTGVNLFDPATRGAFLNYLSALARHLREKHAGGVIAVSLETKMTRLPAETDYSPAAVQHFRAWMQTTCGKIEAVNGPWGSELRSFDELAIPLPRMEAPDIIGPNRPDGEPPAEAAKWHDWIAWRKAWLTEYFAMQADVIRRELPGVPIQAYAIEANSHEAHSERPVSSWPLQEMGTLADLPSSCATVEPVQVLLRRVGAGRFTGVQAEQNFGSMLGGCAYAGFLKDALYSVARDGADTILRYFYAPGLYGYMDRQLNWDGAYSFRLKMREMHTLAPLIENTRPARTPVAMLWSESSYDQDPTVYSRWGALGTSYAMMCAKVHYDIVLEADVQRGELANYSLLIIPEQRYLMDATLGPIREFVRNGGTVFATSVPGMFDERGRERGQPLADVFGADVKAFTPIQAVPGTMLVPTRPNSIWGDRERGADRGNRFIPDEWSLRLQLAACFTPREGAEIVHSYADGSAAMVRNKFGNGSAVILGYPFGHEYAYSNPTEMSFGKIYPHFSYPPQMTALENWLGRLVREQLGHAQPVQVPKSWMDRFTGRERSAPSLTYPGLGDTYESKRLETDAPNHSLAIGLRERDGIGTQYLTVFNRDSAYAVNRGYIHYMASPTHAIIRLNRTDVRAIYDVVNRCHVPFVAGDMSQRAGRDGKFPEAGACVSFHAIIPAYFGRVYAISSKADEPRVELFESLAAGRPVPGVSDAELVKRVSAFAHKVEMKDVLVWNGKEGEAELRAWLAELQAARAQNPQDEVVISYGSPEYRPAAEKLAERLTKAGLQTRISGLGIRNFTDDPDPYYRLRSGRYERPLAKIDVFIGNDWDNTNLADLTGAWQASRHANPILPVSVNRQFPGGGRAVLMVTRPFSVSLPNAKSFPEKYHVFKEQPRSLVIGASSPDGAVRGVEAFGKLAR